MVKATACVLALEDLLQQFEIGDDNHPGQRVFVHIGQLTGGQLAPDILDILGFVNIELQVRNVLVFLPTPSSEPVGQCQCAKNGACNTPCGGKFERFAKDTHYALFAVFVYF